MEQSAMPMITVELVGPVSGSLFPDKKGQTIEVQEEGECIVDVLNGLAEQYPDFDAQVFDADRQQMRPTVQVLLNGQPVPAKEGLDTTVGAGDRLTLRPA